MDALPEITGPIIVQDARGHGPLWKGHGEPVMWSWIGGPKWFKVTDHPVPKDPPYGFWKGEKIEA